MNALFLTIVLIQIRLSQQYRPGAGLLDDAIQALEATSGDDDRSKSEEIVVSTEPVSPSYFTSEKPDRVHKKRRKRLNQLSPSSTAPPQHLESGTTKAPDSSIGIPQEYDLLSAINLQLKKNNGDSKRMVRRKRQVDPFAAAVVGVNSWHTAHYVEDIAPWVHWVAPNFIPSTPRVRYGLCSFHNHLRGSEPDSECLPGEICADSTTHQLPPDCPTPPTDCTCPNPAPVPDSCPLGCLTSGCTVQMHGTCIDDTKPTEQFLEGQYDHTDVPTPMVDYSGTLTHDQECTAYGDAIDSVQKGSTSIENKEKNLDTNQASNKFGTEICNWPKAHLECIPKEHRMTTTTVANQPPTQAQIDDYERPKGTCQCMLALGSRPAIVKEEIGEHEVDVCYIPANMGLASECDHEIVPPHGIIEGVTDDGGYLFKGNEPAAKFCVPDSECRIGYKYTGLRCMCKPKTIWDPKTGTCSKSWRIVTDNVTTTWASLYLIFRYFYF